MSRQKELDADLKAVQQIEFVGQKKWRWYKFWWNTMLILTILGKIKETRLKFSQGCVTVL